MGRSSTATLNYQLTNFAVGKMNGMATEEAQKLARRFIPTVTTPGVTGQFKSFNDDNAFAVYKTARAMGGDPTRMQFNADDAYYNCKPHALEITIDEWERKQVGEQNAVGQQLLDEGRVGAVVGASARSHAVDAMAYVEANTTAIADRGNWVDPGVDPLDQIDEQLDALSLAVGSTAGIMLDLDVTAWRALRANEKVKKRCGGVQVGPITREQLVAALLFPVDLNIANLVVHSSKPVAAVKSKVRVMASRCYLHFSVANPTVYDPSPFKNFSVGMGTPVAAVRSWQAPNGLYEGHFLDWSRDFEVTSSVAIRRVDITVAAPAA